MIINRERTRNSLSLVVAFVDVSGSLVVESEDGPRGLALPLPLMRLALGLSHLPLKLQQRRRYQVPSFRGLLAATQPHAGHILVAITLGEPANSLLREESVIQQSPCQ